MLLLKERSRMDIGKERRAPGRPIPPEPTASETAPWQETFGLCCWQYALSRVPGVQLHYSAVSFLLVKELDFSWMLLSL